jgi:hypothetical protein
LQKEKKWKKEKKKKGAYIPTIEARDSAMIISHEILLQKPAEHPLCLPRTQGGAQLSTAQEQGSRGKVTGHGTAPPR